MKKIMCIVQPFMMSQTIYVYENGNKLDALQIDDINKLNETIFNLTDKYNIQTVEFVGPEKFARGLGHKLQEEELSKYSKNLIEIKYMKRS